MGNIEFALGGGVASAHKTHAERVRAHSRHAKAAIFADAVCGYVICVLVLQLVVTRSEGAMPISRPEHQDHATRDNFGQSQTAGVSKEEPSIPQQSLLRGQTSEHNERMDMEAPWQLKGMNNDKTRTFARLNNVYPEDQTYATPSFGETPFSIQHKHGIDTQARYSDRVAHTISQKQPGQSNEILPPTEHGGDVQRRKLMEKSAFVQVKDGQFVQGCKVTKVVGFNTYKLIEAAADSAGGRWRNRDELAREMLKPARVMRSGREQVCQGNHIFMHVISVNRYVAPVCMHATGAVIKCAY